MSRRGSILQDYGGHLNPMPTDAQLAAASYYQRDKEFNAQMKLNDSGNKLRDYKDATKFIYDQNIDRTGINDLDIENANQLLSAKNEMVRMLNEDKATLQDVQLYAMRTLPKIDKAYTLGKNYKTQMDKIAIDMEKKYGNGFDINAFYTEGNKKLVNDLFDKNEDGKIIGYKDPSLIPKNRDYAAEIENDNASLGTIFKPSGALVKHLSSLPTPVISNSTEVKGKDGRLRYNGYTGQGSVFVEEDIDPETGVTKGLRYKSEKVPLGVNDDGTTRYAEVLPVDEMGIIMENPAVAKEVDYKFKNYLGEIKKQSSEHGWGDGFKEITEFDPRAIDILKRGFVRDWLIETNADGSAFNPKMKDIAPTTKIYNGSGSKKNDTQDFVLRYKNAVEGRNVDKAVDIARELFAGNGKYTFDELKINKNDMGAVLSYKDDLGETQYETLKLDDPNVYLKLAGLYQKITGSDSKLEGNIFQGKKDYTNKVKEEYTNIQSLIDSKGKTIQAGVKNGKWYDTKTGKPIE